VTALQLEVINFLNIPSSEGSRQYLCFLLFNQSDLHFPVLVVDHSTERRRKRHLSTNYNVVFLHRIACVLSDILQISFPLEFSTKMRERGWLFVLFLGGVKNNFVSHALVMIIKIVWGKCLQNLLYISFLSVYTSDRNKTKSELQIWHPKHHSSS